MFLHISPMKWNKIKNILREVLDVRSSSSLQKVTLRIFNSNIMAKPVSRLSFVEFVHGDVEYHNQVFFVVCKFFFPFSRSQILFFFFFNISLKLLSGMEYIYCVRTMDDWSFVQSKSIFSLHILFFILIIQQCHIKIYSLVTHFLSVRFFFISVFTHIFIHFI